MTIRVLLAEEARTHAHLVRDLGKRFIGSQHGQQHGAARG
ncbi:hypothetical protein HDA32_000113 [Spinactinospora alkalitolerans]|uniref:Uncharacterized protein n=1 Tax=Spinactinospora alkalitolerans TaxID=687207 RepID=A0A852TQP3_9ACTN|nr:hypothetical protein [Spinactinospora alkalitolerans]